MTRTIRAALIKRLNLFLEFIYENLADLTNGAWEEMLDRLYFAMYGRKRDRALRLKNFNLYSARESGSVRTAQAMLYGVFGDPHYDLRKHTALGGPPRSFASGNNQMEFPLAASTFKVQLNEGRGFLGDIESTDLPTNVYTRFFILLRETGLKSHSDFYNCANDKCGRLFVPLRKPHQGKPAYCSPKCTNRVAALEYRKRKGEALKSKEQERSHSKYVKRQKQKFPGVAVKRRPRKKK